MTHACTACGHIDEINPAALMGAAKSEAKAAAARKNGAAPAKGVKPRGWPKGKPRGKKTTSDEALKATA